MLATISRHAEHPATTPAGSSKEAPLVVVEVVNDIDADTAPLLRTVLAHTIRHNRRVCCDLSQAAFLGADAVNTLSAACADADQAGSVFTVRGVHGFGVRVFQITGLDDFLASRA